MGNRMMLVDTTLKRLSKVLIFISGLFLSMMMLHVVSDVLLRYLFNSPIPGTAEVVAHYYMVAAVFLPLPFVEMRNSGISVDLLYATQRKVIRRAMIFLALVGQIAFFSILAYQSALDAWHSFSILEYLSVQIKITIWPASFFLPIGFGVAVLASLLRMVQLFTRKDWEDACHATKEITLPEESK